MIIQSTPEPAINEDTCMEDVQRQIAQTRLEKKKLTQQVDRIQQENRERIAALEVNFKMIKQLVEGLESLGEVYDTATEADTP